MIKGKSSTYPTSGSSCMVCVVQGCSMSMSTGPVGRRWAGIRRQSDGPIHNYGIAVRAGSWMVLHSPLPGNLCKEVHVMDLAFATAEWFQITP